MWCDAECSRQQTLLRMDGWRKDVCSEREIGAGGYEGGERKRVRVRARVKSEKSGWKWEWGQDLVMHGYL